MALKAMGLDARRASISATATISSSTKRSRIAVRYAIPTADREQTYRKRNGEVSRYVYKRWTFNFHRHGELGDRYCDFFVCFLASADTKARGSSDVSVFAIPWEAITGLTFCSSVREGSTRSYRGKYAQVSRRLEFDRAFRGATRRLRTIDKRLTNQRRQSPAIAVGGAGRAHERGSRRELERHRRRRAGGRRFATRATLTHASIGARAASRRRAPAAPGERRPPVG